MNKKKLLLIIGMVLIIISLSLIYADLTENIWSGSNAGTGGIAVTNTANADGSTTDNWASAVDDNNHWSADGAIWTFTMDDSAGTQTIGSVTLYLKHYQSGYSNDGFNIDVYDGTAWTTVQSYSAGTSPPTSDTANNWDVSATLDTWTKIDAAQIRIIGTGKSGGHDAVTWYVDTVELRVVETDTLPNITSLDYPPNNNYLNNGISLDFNFTVQDDTGFTNCTLYGNWSGGWHANQTITNINNGSVTNFTSISLLNGTYIWNVWCFDNATTPQSDWFDSNYTLTVDTISPGLVLNSPANDTISQDSFKLLNVTVTDNRNEIIVKIYGGNETDFYKNNSLIYKRTVVNGTEITYNWTAPVLNVTSETVLLMHFDDEANNNATHVEDETGINNGTKSDSGAPVWNESGKFGYALGFDGVDDSVSIADNNSLDLIGNFSISFWTYPTDLTKNQTFLAKGSGTTTNYYIDFKETDDNKIEFGFYNGAWRSVSVNGSSITANQWNLITVTRNASSNISRVYINGDDKGSLQLNYLPVANSNALKLGSFPGYNQNFTGLLDELIIYNKTLTDTEITNIYQLKNGDWYWQVEVNDTASNLNVSLVRTFEIGSVWYISPTDLGSVGAALDVNVSVGILIINNTHASRNVTINISEDYSGVVTFNETLPINLTAASGNVTRIQINVTSPATDGSTVITFNITATDYTGADSVPASTTVPVTLIATSSQPFLITNFETYPTSVSQNNTGITLKASVTNRGQGSAQNVKITFELPSGWTNATGALTSSAFLLNVNEQQNYSITADINSTATAGSVTLYANVSGQNSTGSDVSSSYLTIDSINVTVNEIAAGGGPAVVVESVGGGGGGGGGGAKAKQVVYDKIIEIIREEEGSFYIEVYNKYINSTLEGLTLQITGYPEQYITTFPSKIDKIGYKEGKNFTVKIRIPAYESYDEQSLKAIIKGYLVKGITKTDYKEIQNIKLIILAAPEGKAKASLEEAKKAIAEMKAKGFNTILVDKLLADAESKLIERRNKDALDLANEIIEIRKLAFRADELIKKIKRVIANPKLIGLITGNIVRELEEIDPDLKEGILTGHAILETRDVSEILNLAVIAFDRGDYRTALERAQLSRVLLVLESKGNIVLFLSIYWAYILFVAILVSITGITGYHSYQKSSIMKKIRGINLEESNIQKSISDAQLKYFNKKISSADYNKLIKQHTMRRAQLQKLRLKLRNKRLRLLKPHQILENLKIETTDAKNKIKKLQFDYFRDRKISKNEYKIRFKNFNELLAEIEGERANLQIRISGEKGGKSIKPKEIKQEDVDKIEKEVEKRGKIRIILLKIWGSCNRLKQKIKEKFRKTDYKDISEQEYRKLKEKRLKEKEEKKRDKEEKAMFRKYRVKKKSKKIIGSFKEFPKKMHRKIKNRSGKNGVVMIDSNIINKLIEKINKRNLKGKWINLSLEEHKTKTQGGREENER